MTPAYSPKRCIDGSRRTSTHAASRRYASSLLSPFSTIGALDGRAAALITALVALACSGPAAPPPEDPPDTDAEALVEALALDAAELAALDPSLRMLIGADPHHYLRFVSNRFVGLSCELADRGPNVNLHGDAHLEQYLVTTLGRGLGDFDEATSGAVSIDLVRLAASIRIASRLRGWDADALWLRFVQGYLAALEDPGHDAPVPSFVTRRRATFTEDHAELLASCDRLMQPVGGEERAQVEAALAGYVDMLQQRDEDLDREHYRVVELGPHPLGIGSRRAGNYLIRTRGPTDAPGDDLVIEAKEVTRNPRARCLPIARRTDPLRILIADARLAYTPFEDVGFVEIDGRPYWIHEWVDDYQELDVRELELGFSALIEVVYDIGVQLGQGHPRGLGDPYEAELRRDLMRFVQAEGEALWETSGRLADATWEAWERLDR